MAAVWEEAAAADVALEMIAALSSFSSSYFAEDLVQIHAAAADVAAAEAAVTMAATMAVEI